MAEYGDFLGTPAGNSPITLDRAKRMVALFTDIRDRVKDLTEKQATYIWLKEMAKLDEDDEAFLIELVEIYVQKAYRVLLANGEYIVCDAKGMYRTPEGEITEEEAVEMFNYMHDISDDGTVTDWTENVSDRACANIAKMATWEDDAANVTAPQT